MKASWAAVRFFWLIPAWYTAVVRSSSARAVAYSSADLRVRQ